MSIARSLAKYSFVPVLSLAIVLISADSGRAIIDSTLQMQLGNPSGATNDPNNHSHYLIVRSVEAIDYSDNLGEPNWASWDLTASDVGSSGRSDAWAADTNLPAGFFEVGPNDYSGSGFDRGHMCPSADRTDNLTDNEMVFLMSNIIPQAPTNNQHVWANLESDCRSLAQAGNELLIICGPARFDGGRIDAGHVGVPDLTWKIVAVVPTGSGTALSRITSSTRIIAVEIPNSNSVSSVWQQYVTTAGQVERDTGFTFFTALPGTVASALRAKVDGTNYPAPSLSSFSPGTGAVNTNVVITGTNFYNTTSVTFNGASALFSVDSNTQITAIVPSNAITGHITVTTASGNVTSTGTFTLNTSASPDLTVVTSHAGNFTQGDSGDVYTINITNTGSASTTGTITVSNFLPAGLTASGMSGAGWTFDLPNLTCTRSDSFGNNAALPPIFLTVNVSPSAPSTVTNFTYVSNSGDTNLQNNTATDVTTITAASAPGVTTGTANNVTSTGATLNGTVNPNNQPASVRFEYGPSTSYTGTSSVPSSVSGNTAQPVSVNIAGLTASTLYHFRTVSSNVLGTTFGADQTFTTAAVALADISIAVAHAGNFAPGDVGDVYTITVTNLGAGASSGTITITDALPAGLTATAISGSGWTPDLATLTCTRSDSLGGGATYPPITVTVNVSASASGTVTNIATVSGGNDSNSANNAGIDPTIIAATAVSNGILVGWDVSAMTGGNNNFGISPLAPTTNAPNLTIGSLTRGVGVGTSGNAAARGWGGNAFTNTSAANAVASNQFFTFSIAANAGYRVSLSGLARFDYRRSSTGPANGVLQYQINSGAFTDITSLSYSSTTNAGASLGPIDFSTIGALQNIGPGTNVSFRIVNYGGTTSAGTWYIFDTSNSPAMDFALQGTVSPTLTPIQSWRLQYFGTTANSGTAADTAILTTDRMPNLLKYALGLNPLVPTNNPVTGDISNGYLRLTLPKNANATDITYYIEVTTDLRGPWSTNGMVVDQNTPTLLQAHATPAIGSMPLRFIRLEVARP